MQINPPRWRWALSGQRCPCLCGGEGVLVFVRCPGCGHVALACNEVGTIFGDSHAIAKGPCGNWLDPSGGTCPSCALVDLSEYCDATLDEVEAAGFLRSQLIDVG